MKLLILALSGLLQGWCVSASDTVPVLDQGSATVVTPQSVERLHARDVLVKRAGRDCGTWTMFCGGVPGSGDKRGKPAVGACNNACYFVNYLSGGEYIATYDPSVDNARNREQSGCQTSDGSVCNAMPFSQRCVFRSQVHVVKLVLL